MLNQQQRYFLEFHSIEVVHIHNMTQDVYEVHMSTEGGRKGRRERRGESVSS